MSIKTRRKLKMTLYLCPWRVDSASDRSPRSSIPIDDRERGCRTGLRLTRQYSFGHLARPSSSGGSAPACARAQPHEHREETSMESVPQERVSDERSSGCAASGRLRGRIASVFVRPRRPTTCGCRSWPARSSRRSFPRLMLAHRPTAEPLAPPAERPHRSPRTSGSSPGWCCRTTKTAFATIERCGRSDVRSSRSTSTCSRRRRATSASCGRTTLQLHRRHRRSRPAATGAARTEPGTRPQRGASVARPPRAAAARPGEQHTFGLVMVAEFFRRAGWDVTGGAWAAGADAARCHGRMVRCGRLLARCRDPPAGADRRIARRQACHLQPRLGILVGGPMFASTRSRRSGRRGGA